MRDLYDKLVRAAAKQLATDSPLDLCLYAEIEDAGFEVNSIVNAAEQLNAQLTA